MLINIRHSLALDYGDPIQRLQLHLLMTPQSGPTQKVLDWTVEIGGEHTRAPMIDGFGNKALFASLASVESPLTITVAGQVETIEGNGVLGWLSGEPVPWLYHRVTPSTKVPVSIWGKFRGEAAQRETQLDALHGLMGRVHETLNARAETETGMGQTQSQSQSLAGNEQSQTQDALEPEVDPALDYARTFVGSARALGIPARFVSGYFLAAGDDKVESGSHAWAEAYVQGLGWIAFDARLDVCPTDRHIRVAVGLDAVTAAPVRAYPVIGDEGAAMETVEISVAAATDA